jgi:competence protein ComEA
MPTFAATRKCTFRRRAAAGMLAFLLICTTPLWMPRAIGQTQSHPRHHRAPAKLDINTASLAQLQAIPGLGPVYAKRILAGRPYTSKHQLKTRGILPPNLYMQVKDRLIAHRPKKKS